MIEIKRANLRDASFIVAHLNEHDRQEVFCQLPDVETAVLAQWILLNGDAWVAYYRDQPIMLFGTSPMTVCALSVWAMGTTRSWRAIPAVSRHFVNVQLPKRIEQGFTSMEARAMVRHLRAREWIEELGGECVAFLPGYGKGGEEFTLYRWTVAGYRSIREGRWSEDEHVLPAE